MAAGNEEFDQFSDDYERRLDDCVRMSGQDADYFAELKAIELVNDLERHGVDPSSATVLDFGCGTGTTSAHIAHRVGLLIGTDVARTAVDRAAERVERGHFLHVGVNSLPLRTGSVDAVIVSCVLHHVDPEQRGAVVAEIARVLAPRGILSIVEHNPFNPATRWIVNRCEFDEDAILLRPSESAALAASAGLDILDRRFILFVPGRAGAVSWFNRKLRRIPLGAQYVVVARPSAR